MRDLHAQRRRQTVAHGAQPARGHPAVRLIEMEVLRRPHLMLAHLGGDVGVAPLRRRIEALDGILRHDDVRVRLVGERIARPPLGDLLPPGMQRLLVRLGGGAPQPHQILQHPADIAQYADVDAHVLVDRGGIDVDVDLLGARRERIQPPGDAVVEPRADAHHHVAVVHGHVGLVGAVHAQHAEPVLARGRIGAQPHQRGGDGKAAEVHQLAQQVAGLRAGIDDAAAGVEDRPLRARHHLHGGLDLVEVALQLRLVAGARRRLRRHVGAPGELDILRNVHHDRAGTAGGCDMERLVDGGGKLVDVLHQPVVLGAGARDADRVAFLEGVGADQRRRHLAGDAHQRNGIHQRVLQGRHRIGSARPGGDQHHARLAGRARIAFGCVPRPLLVAHEDVLDRLLLEKLVVDGKHRAARIAEDVLDAVVDQRLHHHFGARHLAPLALSVAHRSGPVIFRAVSASAASSPVSGNKKGPRGSLCVAHGWMPPGGYTALPMRHPTRMSAIFMGADNKGESRGASMADFAFRRHQRPQPGQF